MKTCDAFLFVYLVFSNRRFAGTAITEQRERERESQREREREKWRDGHPHTKGSYKHEGSRVVSEDNRGYVGHWVSRSGSTSITFSYLIPILNYQL